MHIPQILVNALHCIVLSIFLHGIQAYSRMVQAQSEDCCQTVEDCRSIIAEAQANLNEEYKNLKTELDQLQDVIPDSASTANSIRNPFTEQFAALENDALTLSKQIQRIASTIYFADAAVQAGRSKEQILKVIDFETNGTTTRQRHAFGEPKGGTFNMLDPEPTSDVPADNSADSPIETRFADLMKDLRDELTAKEFERFRIEKQLQQIRTKACELQLQIERHRILAREMQTLKQLNRLYTEQLKRLRPKEN